jgi:hypothetical protein
MLTLDRTEARAAILRHLDIDPADVPARTLSDAAYVGLAVADATVGNSEAFGFPHHYVATAVASLLDEAQDRLGRAGLLDLADAVVFSVHRRQHCDPTGTPARCDFVIVAEPHVTAGSHVEPFLSDMTRPEILAAVAGVRL